MIKVRVEGDPAAHSVEEEKLHAECFGNEDSRKLDFAKECLDIFGWDIEVDKRWIDGLAAQYERIVT